MASCVKGAGRNKRPMRKKMNLSNEQRENLQKKKTAYEARIKSGKKLTAEEIVLNFLEDQPNEWFYTWELMGGTQWGWLSHATHATLRRLEQKGEIYKDYVGKYVVYTCKTRHGVPESVLKGGFYSIGDGNYIVDGTKNNKYKVHISGDGFKICNCPDFTYRKAPCKHIKMVEIFLESQRVAQEKKLQNNLFKNDKNT